jgi:hypothetical protein
LDFKPYHYVDSIPHDQLRFPSWLLDSKDRGRVKDIQIEERARIELQQLVETKKLDFYGNSPKEAATDVLEDV